ncbi:lys-63-specific deubiquitinase BRCC36-like isoform X2 [Juglans microcarpa x Juglans regia]|uniref:lys-63-specific deubiquitinase BRCC36-like isoform X2 n=2 Tax=Juglans microcarpa x Juglans regia TaxID=2249226 RepID=UPI001B7EF420|nr:lys-63-specific deubiquitinase BRCC36-like isoform X2 [Juglans microcarpa x Juglans regia]
MALTCVKMSEDVWLTCMTHALSTETEEIMGLLLGDIEYSKDGGVTALIWGASPQTRSDRRKDRVETNPEQLAAASAQAERMTTFTGRITRVIGWYHSHPHITVLPSHVDVRTQAMYQLLDSGFIGLIFSCFSEDVHKVGRIQVIAFQSSDRKQNHVSRPISLSVVNKSSIIDVESSLSSSEDASTRSGSAVIESSEQDCGDSITAGANKGGGRSAELGVSFADSDAKYIGRERVGGNYRADSSDKIIVDIDPMDMSESMQEAMHRSNLDMSGAEYARKEIPLHVLPTSSLIKLDSPLMSFTDLQHVLYEEERAAYNQAILQNIRNGKVHPLTFIHHTSTYQASMCKLMEYCLSPAVNALQDRLKENEIRVHNRTKIDAFYRHCTYLMTQSMVVPILLVLQGTRNHVNISFCLLITLVL